MTIDVTKAARRQGGVGARRQIEVGLRETPGFAIQVDVQFARVVRDEHMARAFSQLEADVEYSETPRVRPGQGEEDQVEAPAEYEPVLLAEARRVRVELVTPAGGPDRQPERHDFVETLGRLASARQHRLDGERFAVPDCVAQQGVGIRFRPEGATAQVHGPVAVEHRAGLGDQPAQPADTVIGRHRVRCLAVFPEEHQPRRAWRPRGMGRKTRCEQADHSDASSTFASDHLSPVRARASPGQPRPPR